MSTENQNHEEIYNPIIQWRYMEEQKNLLIPKNRNHIDEIYGEKCSRQNTSEVRQSSDRILNQQHVQNGTNTSTDNGYPIFDPYYEYGRPKGGIPKRGDHLEGEGGRI